MASLTKTKMVGLFW